MSDSLTESAVVQKPLIRYAAAVGWTYIPPDNAVGLRRGEKRWFFYDLLREKLLALNPGIVTESNVDEIIKRLEQVRPSIEGNFEVLEFLRGEKTVYVEADRQERHVRLIDFEHWQNNSFHVTDEWAFSNGVYTNRADVMLLINGVPVIVVETKSAQKEEGIAEAIDQIRRYHRETPEMMTAPQIF